MLSALSNFDCCLLLNTQEDNFENTMRAMKPSIQSAHFVPELVETKGDRTENRSYLHININPRIVNCDFGNNPSMDPLLCDAFSIIITNTGLAYGLNVRELTLFQYSAGLILR